MKEVRDKELYYYYEEHISYLETTLELLEKHQLYARVQMSIWV